MRKFFIVLVTVTMVLGTSCINVSAIKTTNNLISNEETHYDNFGNYNNLETGEYFRWDNPFSRSASRSFSFKIRYNVTSGKFTLGGSHVQINLGRVYFEHANGSASSCCNNHKFEVNVYRNSSGNIAKFTAPFGAASSSLGGGFSTTSEYKVQVSNIDGLPYLIYLTGSGSVYSY